MFAWLNCWIFKPKYLAASPFVFVAVDANFNTAAAHGIGRHTNSNTYPYDGSMSHIHFCDGYSYGPDSFGSTDSTTGQWKIKYSEEINTKERIRWLQNKIIALKWVFSIP